MHHIFTNSQLYDEDIQHEYKVYLYEFLYLKWRFDSFVEAVKSKQYVSKLNYFRSKSLALPSIMLFFSTIMTI